MFQKTGQMPPEEIFSRSLFGVLLIGSFFVSWGKWLSLIMGVLFLISAYSGFCLTCYLYKKFFAAKPK